MCRARAVASVRLGALLAALAVTATSRTPGAQPADAALPEPPPAAAPPEKIRLAFSAPPECPDSAHFLEAVRSRAGTDWEAPPDELARPIDVTVVRNADRYVASIRFSSVAGETLDRQVTGQSCENVVNGIALVTALAIRSQVHEVLEQSEAPPPPPAPAPVSAPNVAGTRPPPAPHAESPRVRVRAGLSGSVVTGVGPESALGAGVFAVVEVSQWRVGLAAHLNDSGEVSAHELPARFRLLSFRLDGCPTSVDFAPWFSLEPCVSFDAGWLEGGTTEAVPPRVVRPETAGSLWAAPGALLRAVVRFDPGFVQVEGFARVRLFREQFYVETDGERDIVYEVPAVAFGGAAGLGVRF
jgi:hypothetical protein